MNTYLKGIKTVAVIFLSLALFSCQEEQIEPQDTLSTTPDELMLNKGPRVNFMVTLNEGTLDADTPDLLTSICDGTVNSKQTLLWFDDDCLSKKERREALEHKDKFITAFDDNFYLHAIRPPTESFEGYEEGYGRYTFGMRGFEDSLLYSNADYRGFFKGPVVDLSKGDTYPINDVDITLYSGWTHYDWGNDYDVPTNLVIAIGHIVITPN